jgi:hypothetical protein
MVMVTKGRRRVPGEACFVGAKEVHHALYEPIRSDVRRRGGPIRSKRVPPASFPALSMASEHGIFHSQNV